MNIQQFQYILAVAETKHFETAAQKCFITQSTLSTMISKFEDEIHIKIFDRKKKPVEVTTEGKILIEQLKTIIKDIHQLNELAKELKGEVTGNLSISVIPTIAPFLLPLFLKDFATQFPNLNIVVKEDTTGEIIRQIKSRELDIGIVSIPLNDTDIIETHLYDEPFVFYDSKNVLSKTTSVNNINMKNLCLLEEGHCMRTQIIKLCEIHKKAFSANLNFEYKAGSIDSLVRFVKAYNATTLLPYLAQIDFSKKEKNHICEFSPPIPYRSVGIITHRHFVKKKISNILQQAIQSKVNVLLPNEKMKGRKLNPL